MRRVHFPLCIVQWAFHTCLCFRLSLEHEGTEKFVIKTPFKPDREHTIPKSGFSGHFPRKKYGEKSVVRTVLLVIFVSARSRCFFGLLKTVSEVASSSSSSHIHNVKGMSYRFKGLVLLCKSVHNGAADFNTKISSLAPIWPWQTDPRHLSNKDH